MVKCQDVMQAMERIAPRRLAEEWDNPGLLVGSPHDEVRKILVALDVREETVECAIEDGCDLIVAHHPLIFRGLKAVRTDDVIGRKIARLIKADIAVFAAHTNLDSAAGGVNDAHRACRQSQDFPCRPLRRHRCGVRRQGGSQGR